MEKPASKSRNIETLHFSTDLAGATFAGEQGSAEVLLRSAAYAAFQSPVNGVLQLFDADGKKGLLKEDSAWQLIAPPPKAEPWSRNWHLEQIGTGVGMILPLVATHKVVQSCFPNKIAALAGEKGLQCLTQAEKRHLVRYEIGVAAGTGALFGGFLTPTQEASSATLGRQRFDQAVSSALTFGTMATVGAGIKSITQPLKMEGVLGKIVRSDSLATALAGIPAGIVAVDSHKFLQTGKLATWDERLQSMYSFSILGAGLGKAMRIGKNSIVGEGAERVGDPRAAIEQPIERVLLEPTSRESGAVRFPDLKIDVPKNVDLTYERTSVSMPRLKEGVTLPETFDSQLQFEQLALRQEPVPVRVYRSPGLKTEVIVPEDYALKLDRVNELKQQAKLEGTAGYLASRTLAEPQWAELAERMTPQDVFGHLQMTPRPSRFQRIVITDQRNPYDAWYASQHRQPGFRSAADSVFSLGETTWYGRERGPGMVNDMLHEWVHHEQKANPLDTAVFQIASRLENQSWPRDYARAPEENFAITLGEHVLHPEGAKVSELVANAPLRAAALGHGLQMMLQEVPLGERGLLHDQLATRAELLSSQASPLARRILVDIAGGEQSPNSLNAVKLLLFLGKAEDFAGLSAVRKLDLSFEPLADAQAQNLRFLTGLRELDLNNTHVSDATLRHLASTPLEVLNLRKTRVTNAGMANLPTSLRTLDISGNPLGDPAVRSLVNLTNLKLLDLQGTRITHVGLGKLVEGLPGIQILD